MHFECMSSAGHTKESRFYTEKFNRSSHKAKKRKGRSFVQFGQSRHKPTEVPSTTGAIQVLLVWSESQQHFHLTRHRHQVLFEAMYSFSSAFVLQAPQVCFTRYRTCFNV